MPEDNFYMVTFDLQNSRGRSNEYSAAEAHLRNRFGAENYWKIVKQCAVIRTADHSRAIRDTLSQRLGSDCNILVVKIARGYALKIRDPYQREKAKKCLQQVDAQRAPDEDVFGDLA